jgi:hypothetical protein
MYVTKSQFFFKSFMLTSRNHIEWLIFGVNSFRKWGGWFKTMDIFHMDLIDQLTTLFLKIKAPKQTNKKP